MSLSVTLFRDYPASARERFVAAATYTHKKADRGKHSRDGYLPLSALPHLFAVCLLVQAKNLINPLIRTLTNLNSPAVQLSYHVVSVPIAPDTESGT